MSQLQQLHQAFILARREFRTGLLARFPIGSIVTASVGGHISEFEIVAHTENSFKDGCLSGRNLKNQKCREFSFTRILGHDFSEHDDKGVRKPMQKEATP